MLPPAPPLLSTTNCWPKAAAELVADQPAHRVGAAARREGHDEAHGLGRPRRPAPRRRRPRTIIGAASEAGKQAPSQHGVSSCASILTRVLVPNSLRHDRAAGSVQGYIDQTPAWPDGTPTDFVPMTAHAVADLAARLRRQVLRRAGRVHDRRRPAADREGVRPLACRKGHRQRRPAGRHHGRRHRAGRPGRHLRPPPHVRGRDGGVRRVPDRARPGARAIAGWSSSCSASAWRWAATIRPPTS